MRTPRRLASLVLALCLAPSVAQAAGAPAETLASFRSGGRTHPIVVSKDHVAVRLRRSRELSRPAVLSAKEFEAFAMMGLAVVPRESVRAEDQVVGYPIWFDKEKGAVGALTHEIVTRATDARGTARIRAHVGFVGLREAHGSPGLFIAEFSSPMTALAAANELASESGIAWAHPNFLVPKDFRQARGPETEPYFGHQWHLENTGQGGGTVGSDVHAKGAWSVTTGDASVVVAVLDGGFEMTHPDLDGAWFVNKSEIPGNGVDDDGNGYVDDVSGWNYWAKTGDPASGMIDDHGTAVAGLVGARRNGKGVTGTCPDCTLLPIVVSWQVADDAAAFRYAASMGASVITNSWGYPVGTPETDVVVEAIAEAASKGRDGKGAVVLFAMNNIDQDDCIGATPDISSLPSVVAVSAVNDKDVKVSFSAWGDCMEFLSTSYDSGRPGITTTDLTAKRGYNNGRATGDLPDLDYTNDFGGTSAATPISAGIFALMLSVNPDLTQSEATALVLSTADKINPTVAGYDARTGFSKKYGYGRINAEKAVRAAQTFKRFSRRDAPAGHGRAVWR